jgi:hypothetical protein
VIAALPLVPIGVTTLPCSPNAVSIPLAGVCRVS